MARGGRLKLAPWHQRDVIQAGLDRSSGQRAGALSGLRAAPGAVQALRMVLEAPRHGTRAEIGILMQPGLPLRALPTQDFGRGTLWG